MRLTHAVEIRQQQSQRIDPRQILASEILAWTTSELEAAVEREMAENPALEARDGGLTLGAGGGGAEDGGLELSSPTLVQDRAAAADALLRAASPRTATEGDAEAPAAPAPSAADGPFLSSIAFGDDANDPIDRIVSHQSLRDHLRQQLGHALGALSHAASEGADEDDDEEAAAAAAAAARKMGEVVRYLIECVDDRGYLVYERAEVAERFRVTPSAVEAAVKAVQTMDPPGVGARDLRECLLLQVEHLELAGEAHLLARRVLRTCWDDLVARREEKIASRLRAPLSEVRNALRFLQRALTPYPGSAFRPAWGGRGAGASLSSASSGGAAARPTSVRPDIVFHRTEAGYRVELTRDLEGHLLVSPLWNKLAERGVDGRVGLHRAEKGGEDATRRYVRDHVDRAEAFLSGLARRGRTLRLIAQALIEHQQGFIETGNRAFLRPLTRQALSEKLRLDESVISRAVAEKWVQLPGGEVVALDAFFGNAHAVREALVKLVAAEDPDNPLSDDEIAEQLTELGFPLARRTVAKYRGLEKILPARLRRRGGTEESGTHGGHAAHLAVPVVMHSPGNVTTARNAPAGFPAQVAAG